MGIPYFASTGVRGTGLERDLGRPPLFESRVTGKDVARGQVACLACGLTLLSTLLGIASARWCAASPLSAHAASSLCVSVAAAHFTASFVVFGNLVGMFTRSGGRGYWGRHARFFRSLEDPLTLFAFAAGGRVVAIRSWKVTAMNNEVRANMAAFLTYLSRAVVPVVYSYSVRSRGQPMGETGRQVTSAYVVSITFTTWASTKAMVFGRRAMRRLGRQIHKHASVINALVPTMPHQRVETMESVDVARNLSPVVPGVDVVETELRRATPREFPRAAAKLSFIAVWAWLASLLLSFSQLPPATSTTLLSLLVMSLAWFLVPELSVCTLGGAEYRGLELSGGVVNKPARHRHKRKARCVYASGTGAGWASVTLAGSTFPVQTSYRLRMRLGSMERILQKNAIPHEWQVYFHPVPAAFLEENPNVLNNWGKARLLRAKSDGQLGVLVEGVNALGGLHAAEVTLTVFSDVAESGAPAMERELVKCARRRATVAGNAMLQTLGIRPRVSISPRTHLVTTLKVRSLAAAGSRLPFALFLGEELADLVLVPDELKKGLEIVVAAEFNTPIDLESAVTLGKTVNMEHNSFELDFGLSRENLAENLLVTGGTIAERERTELLFVQKILPLDGGALYLAHRGRAVEKLACLYSDTPLAQRLYFARPGEDFWIHLFYPHQLEAPRLGEGEAFLKDVAHAAAMSFNLDRKQETFVYSQLLEVRKTSDVDAVLQGINDRLLEIKGAHESAALVNAEGMYLLDQFCAGTWAGVFERKADLPEVSELLEDHSDKVLVVDLSGFPPDVTAFLSLVLLVKVQWVSELRELDLRWVVTSALDHYFPPRRSWTDAFSSTDPFLCWVERLNSRGVALTATTGLFSNLPGLVLREFPNTIAHRTRSREELNRLSDHMNLRDYVGTGHYSVKRKDAYQLKFLQVAGPREAVVKRSDYPEPFPVVLDEPDEPGRVPPGAAVDFMAEVHGLVRRGRPQVTTLMPTEIEQDFRDLSIFTDAVVELGEVLAADPTGHRGFTRTTLNQVLARVIRPHAQIHGMDPKGDAYRLRKVVEDVVDRLIELKYVVPRFVALEGEEPVAPRYEVTSKFTEAIGEYRGSHVRPELPGTGREPAGGERGEVGEVVAELQEPLFPHPAPSELPQSPGELPSRAVGAADAENDSTVHPGGSDELEDSGTPLPPESEPPEPGPGAEEGDPGVEDVGELVRASLEALRCQLGEGAARGKLTRLDPFAYDFDAEFF
ncbi:MAG: hypothetical protein ACTSU5_22150 [Promethearchaeota archaeon]